MMFRSYGNTSKYVLRNYVTIDASAGVRRALRAPFRFYINFFSARLRREMGTRRAAKVTAEVQEEQKFAETETKRVFDLLSKKLDTMNTHQERRHGEICEKIEAFERSTSKLTSDIGSLKESCSKLEDELAGVKNTVEDKADMSKVL